MLSFLAPLMLAALAALTVPLAVHLWSRGEPRRVAVGSLRFLEASAARHARQLRLTQVPLLLVRLALVAVLAFLLARPVWTAPASESSERPEQTLLVAPSLFAETPRAALLQEIDSLRRAGVEARWLTAGLPRIAEGEIDAALEGGRADTTVQDIWSLLREADAKGFSDELIVAAPSRLADFQGARPALRARVRWREGGGGGVNRWVQAARRLPGDSLGVALGVSRPAITRFERTAEPARNGALPVRLDGDTVRLSRRDAWPADDARRVAPAADTLRVRISRRAERREDARYVVAAFRAAARTVRRPLIVEQTEEADAAAKADWLIWLRPDAAPEAFTGRLLEDARGRASEAIASVVVMPEARGTPPALYRRTPFTGEKSEDGAALWTDGFGQPLLVAAGPDAAARLRFFSRFHPSWSDLVLQPAFPRWVLEEISGSAGDVAVHDRRRISTRQRAPMQDTAAVRQASEEPVTARLHKPLWMIAFLLFVFERWLAHRQAA